MKATFYLLLSILCCSALLAQPFRATPGDMQMGVNDAHYTTAKGVSSGLSNLTLTGSITLGGVARNSWPAGGGSQTNILLANVLDAGTAAYSNASAFMLAGTANLQTNIPLASVTNAGTAGYSNASAFLLTGTANLQTNIPLASVTNAGTAGYSNTSAFDLSGAASNATNKLDTDLRAALAPKASPALTGTPTAPTAAINNNSTTIATTAYVDGKMTVKASTVNVTNTSTTGAKITSLDTTTGTGTFIFKYFILWANTNSGTGIKFGVNHSGTVTTIAADVRWQESTTTASTGAASQVAAGGTLHAGGSARSLSTTAPNLGPSASADSTLNDMLAIIEGVMVVTVTGDLQLYSASEVASTTYVKKDSVLILTRAL